MAAYCLWPRASLCCRCVASASQPVSPTRTATTAHCTLHGGTCASAQRARRLTATTMYLYYTHQPKFSYITAVIITRLLAPLPLVHVRWHKHARNRNRCASGRRESTSRSTESKKKKQSTRTASSAEASAWLQSAPLCVLVLAVSWVVFALNHRDCGSPLGRRNGRPNVSDASL
eukprot:scaffold2163_cov120-Isochrysis_galbana.AAC.9